jgi:ribosomal protein L29
MTTEPTNTFENLRTKITSRLENAKKEIEELSLQFNLGKAEASDKFESVKKDFHAKVNEWKLMGEQLKPVGKEKLQELKTKLEELQVQLALGKAEAKELFQEQKKKIMQSITDLESEIKKKV